MDFGKVIGIKTGNNIITKIQDNGGNIIWEYKISQYRQLEYIHFSGAEYINTLYVPNYNTSIKFKFKWLGPTTNTSDENDCILGGYCNTLSDSSRRLYWVYSAGSYNKYRAVIGGTWNVVDLTADNNIHWLGLGCPNNSNFKNAAWGLRSGDWSAVEYYKNQTNNTSFTGWTTQFTLGCQGTTGNNGVDSNRYSLINVYEGYQHNVASPWGTTESDNAIRHWVPAQRKSDNVCGLWDTLNNVFYPMIGTNITIAAAGPTVYENPTWSPTYDLSYIDSGGDGDRDWSNTYSSPNSGDYPYTLTISNIPENIKTIKLSCSYRCGYSESSGQNAYNKVICDETVLKESSRADGNYGTLSGSINNKYITVGSSNKVLLQAILNYQSGTSGAHMLTLQYNASAHTITCTINQYAGSGGVYNRIWLSNINLEWYCI